MNSETGQSEVQGGDPTESEESGSLESGSGAIAEAGTGGEGEEQGGQGQQQSKSRNAKQRLRRKLQESEAEKARLAEDNRKQAERLAALEQKVDGVVNPPPQRPSRVDFDSEEAYEDALFDYRQEMQRRESSTTAKPAQQERPEATGKPSESTGQQPLPPGMNQDQFDSWLDRCDDAADKYEDFDQVINRQDVPVTLVMADAIRHDEQGAEVAYYLGKNPAIAAEIAQKPLAQQVSEITKLSKTFTSSTTNAPDPIKPPGGGDDTLGVKNPEKMSPEQYRDMRRRQMAERR